MPKTDAADSSKSDASQKSCNQTNGGDPEALCK